MSFIPELQIPREPSRHRISHHHRIPTSLTSHRNAARRTKEGEKGKRERGSEMKEGESSERALPARYAIRNLHELVSPQPHQKDGEPHYERELPEAGRG
ncbi:hypothetical protein BDN70DRAFT_128353 [Pholiota conissans]|uniref:Uncharacterized protein n=1 Tax=Pholiota conissans TaxID=109636 RepID=A0A9P5YXB2_9AGAR|nr:hypothetical protein BDN70DRAFT_128353 [Pholiota conissans]